MIFWKIIPYVYLSLGAKLVEYRLGYNYGEVFHDFSGNSRDGVNGDSSTTTSKDTIATDRGSYFDNGDFQITLPSNDQQSTAFTLPSTFTIAAWVITYNSDGMIFYRYKDINNYFYVKRDKVSDNILARIKIGGADTGDVLDPNNCWVERN